MNPLAFFKQVKGELGRVIWPTREYTVQATLLVIVISLVVAAYVGGLDFIFTSIVNELFAR